MEKNSTRELAIVLFTIFAVLFWLDAYFSVQFIKQDILFEGNKFIRWAIETSGTVQALYWIKAVMFGVCAGCLNFIHEHRPRTTIALLVGASVLYLYVVITGFEMAFNPI